ELQHFFFRDALLKNSRIEKHAFRKRNCPGIERYAEFGRQFDGGLSDSYGAFFFGRGAVKFPERCHGVRKPLRRCLRRRAVQRADRPEVDFSPARLDNFLLVTARDDVRNEINIRIDQKTLDYIIAVHGALQSIARSENSKIRRRKYREEFFGRIPSSPGKNTDGSLPDGKRCFVGDK